MNQRVAIELGMCLGGLSRGSIVGQMEGLVWILQVIGIVVSKGVLVAFPASHDLPKVFWVILPFRANDGFHSFTVTLAFLK